MILWYIYIHVRVNKNDGILYEFAVHIICSISHLNTHGMYISLSVYFV